MITGLMWRLVEFVDRQDVRRVGLVLLGTVGVMGVIGVLAAALDPGNLWLDLDSEVAFRWPIEQTTVALPALWSGLLLLGSAVLWLTVARAWSPRSSRVLAGALATVLLFMSVEEVFQLHERLEFRLGIDWQVLYAPVALFAALVALALLVRMRRIAPSATVLLFLGCATWIASQALEPLEWHGDREVSYYVLLMVPEELGEAVGSILIALAAVSLVKAIMATRRMSRCP
jgi:hypothetical protein